MRIRYTAALMGYFQQFWKTTGVEPRDLIEEDRRLLFVVDAPDVSRALGRGGLHIQKLSTQLDRTIKVIGFHPGIKEFIADLFQPIKPKQIDVEKEQVVVTANSSEDRGVLIGRNAQNIKNATAIVQRYFPTIKQIRVI